MRRQKEKEPGRDARWTLGSGRWPVALFGLVGSLAIWGGWWLVTSDIGQRRPVAVAISASVAIAIGLGLLLWKLPQRHVATLVIPSDKDRTELENELRRTLAQIIGGVAFFTGIYFSWESLHVTREGQITDRFSRAIAQLGSKRQEVSMGGLVALDRVARDSPQDYWSIMEILTAYIRRNAPWPGASPKLEPTLKPNEIQIRPREDIQMALRILGHRAHSYGNGEDRHLNLNATDLRGADLWGAHFEGAHFWEANLEQTELWNSHLQGAYFVRAHMSRVRLDEADLQGGHLEDAELWEAHLYRARFERAYLWRAQLGWAWLEDAHFEGACLKDASLKGAYPKLARFDGAVLEGADLREITPEFLQQEQIATTCMDEKTQLPPHLTRTPACTEEVRAAACTDK